MYVVHTKRLKCVIPPPDNSASPDLSKFFKGPPFAKVTEIKNSQGQDIAPVFDCFAADSTVMTPFGPMNMSSLQTGTQVLSLENGALPSYKPVMYWIHRNPEQEADFFVLETDSPETSLTLTGQHLLFRVPCRSDPWQFNLRSRDQVAFAREMEVGQCVLTTDRLGVKVARVLSIRKERRRGIYAPVTANGVLVVDGVTASCFMTARDHNLLKTVFHKTAQILRSLVSLVPLPFAVLPDPLGWENAIDVPDTLKVIAEHLRNLFPTSLLQK